MPAYVSHNSYDCYQTNLVSVIASFDTDGHIKPLYVRIGEESLKVHSAWMKPSSYSGIMEFNCKVIDNDFLKPLVLTYHHRENVWTIPKNNIIDP